MLSALVFWSTAICVAYLLMVFGAYAILVVFAATNNGVVIATYRPAEATAMKTTAQPGIE